MRKVVYFLNGTVADFEIDDGSYDEFTEQLTSKPTAGDEKLVEFSRQVLEKCVQEGRKIGGGDEELSAACYIWHFFNETEDPERQLDGDIIVIDQTGKGREIQYAPLSQVSLSRES